MRTCPPPSGTASSAAWIAAVLALESGDGAATLFAAFITSAKSDSGYTDGELADCESAPNSTAPSGTLVSGVAAFASNASNASGSIAISYSDAGAWPQVITLASHAST